MYAVGKCRNQANVTGEVYPSSEGSECSFTNELPHLHTLICVRLCISIMIGAYSISKDPTNEYLKLHAHPAKEALRKMLRGAGTGCSLSAPVADASATHALDPSSLLRLFTRVSEEILALGSDNDGPALASLLSRIAS
jgi:hypothetical protein